MNPEEKISKEKFIYELFESISGGYDSANDRISFGMQRLWKRTLRRRIAKALPRKGKLLDICCGTGDIGLSVIKDRGDVRVTAADFSPAMLETARKKAGGDRRIRFVQADAMKLPFKGERFDAASISFGLRNTADYFKVLSEMARVTKVGGYVFCLDSFVPENPVIKPFYRLYFKYIMPAIGGGKKHLKEYQWLSRSTEEFVSPGELKGLFEKAGLRAVGSRRMMFGACVLTWGIKVS